MTPEELRSAIDDAWPVEIRFLIEKAADNWSESLRHEEIMQNDLIKIIRGQNRKMSGKLFSRMRAKGWRSSVTDAEKVCKDVEEEFGYIQPNNKDHETQEAKHPEADGSSPSRTETRP